MDSTDVTGAREQAAREWPLEHLAVPDGGRLIRVTRRERPRHTGWLKNARGAVTPTSRGGIRATMENRADGQTPILLDGSHGEGGGQILRTALSLSILTGRSFRMVRVRANRDKPGLRPQHLKAVEAAAELSGGQVRGAEVGSREVTFQPGDRPARDLTIDIGTAGSTSLILQTLQLPLAMRAQNTIRLTLIGGTFNPMAPAYSFLEATWRAYLAKFGLAVELEMPKAGFYPRGGGRIEAGIEPGRPLAWMASNRGKLRGIRGTAGVCHLRDDIARRMQERVRTRLQEYAIDADIELVQWTGPGQGAAISLTAEYDHMVPATFAGLGERGKPAEAVADEAVDAWLAFDCAAGAAVDPHSADQILLPLALADGPSEYSVSEITEHLRTNARTIQAFVKRRIQVEDAGQAGVPGRVIVAENGS